MPRVERLLCRREVLGGDRGRSPTAAQIRVEGARQPQWTMSSTVKDILLEGSTNRHNMRLSGFLRSKLGDGWVVEEYNMTMEVFVLRPTKLINDNEILDLITALPSHEELEAITTLYHEGVVSLKHRRDYEWRDTITPLATAKLDRAFDVGQRDLEQHPQFTISTAIEDVLFKGRVCVNEMKLNDFLVKRLDGKGAVDANRNALLKVMLGIPGNISTMKEYWAK
ncbi:retrotransposon hot spot (RHS) protein, putative [Trypanosoma cruzi marinkellei]|uniref:Retrotransposon hot spot (RHS) protein, putative n=1 Tax=Trypanosoma cruzi marinkellei TaxID=85056 RepID=K2MUE8_TRYCR|nr:retrotransposon hot spot (RHS) protein, putative [Trypanosoma cruzi marinkellei]